MKSLLKFLGLAAVIVLAGLWIMTVSKSCNKGKLADVPKLETDLKDKVTEVKDDVESLFEGETEEEGLFNEDGDEITDEGDDEDDDEGDDEDDESTLEDEAEARRNASNAAGKTSASNAGMEYLVIGGAFLTEANAKAEVRRLQKKGYDDAEVVTFDYSQYHSVCAERTSSLNSARAIKNKLVTEGNPEAYVHKKRSYKKK